MPAAVLGPGDRGLVPSEIGRRRRPNVAGHFPFAIESAARMWPGVQAAALAGVRERALLFLAGDSHRHDEWRRRAADIGGMEVAVVCIIPMDRRHRSKLDISSLLANHAACC